MTDQTIDKLALVLPAPLLELVIDVSEAITDILRGIVDWLGDLTQLYTYN